MTNRKKKSEKPRNRMTSEEERLFIAEIEKLESQNQPISYALIDTKLFSGKFGSNFLYQKYHRTIKPKQLAKTFQWTQERRVELLYYCNKPENRCLKDDEEKILWSKIIQDNSYDDRLSVTQLYNQYKSIMRDSEFLEEYRSMSEEQLLNCVTQARTGRDRLQLSTGGHSKVEETKKYAKRNRIKRDRESDDDQNDTEGLDSFPPLKKRRPQLYVSPKAEQKEDELTDEDPSPAKSQTREKLIDRSTPSVYKNLQVFTQSINNPLRATSTSTAMPTITSSPRNDLQSTHSPIGSETILIQDQTPQPTYSKTEELQEFTDITTPEESESEYEYSDDETSTSDIDFSPAKSFMFPTPTNHVYSSYLSPFSTTVNIRRLYNQAIWSYIHSPEYYRRSNPFLCSTPSQDPPQSHT